MTESLLSLLQGDAPSVHPGIVDGYERLRAEGLLDDVSVVPVFGPRGTERGEAFWDEQVALVAETGVSLVVLDYYHDPALPDPRPAIARMRAAGDDLKVVATVGDAFMNGWFGRTAVPRSFLQAAEVADLVLTSSMGLLADRVRSVTTAPIVLWPNAVCQVRFEPPPDGCSDAAPDFDVVFIGSRNQPRNPFKAYHRYGRARTALVEALGARFGDRFAVFGHGWDGHIGNRGPVPFEQQHRAARRGRVLVGGVPFSHNRYYTSNRVFFQASSGVPFVDTAVPGVDTLLRPDDHWVLAPAEDLVDAVARTLEMDDDERQAMGRRAAAHIFDRHTQADRCRTLLETVSRLRSGSPTPYLPFLLEEVDQRAEARLATDGWPGLS